MSFSNDLNRFESEYPLQKRRVNGLTFNYRMGGQGPDTIILLVGGLGFSDMFFNHIMGFSNKYRVITFDYPMETYRNSELARGISQFIVELELGKVVLAGQSFGGLLAQVIAREHPEQVKSLILSNTGCLAVDLCQEGRDDFYKFIKGLKKVKFLTRLVPLSLLKVKFMEKLQKYLIQCKEEEKPYFEELFRHIVGKINKKYERHMCRLMINLIEHGHMKSEDFSYLEGKVLLLLSEEDYTFSEEMRDDLIRIMPSPTVNRNLGKGHLALIFDWGEYIKTVDAFLSDLTHGELES